MEIKRKTDIFVETKRRYVIHHPVYEQQIVCSECSEQMLTAEQTAAVLQVSRREVYRLIEDGLIHFCEIENGILLVCPNSIAGKTANDGAIETRMI